MTDSEFYSNLGMYTRTNVLAPIVQLIKAVVKLLWVLTRLTLKYALIVVVKAGNAMLNCLNSGDRGDNGCTTQQKHEALSSTQEGFSAPSRAQT